MSEDNLLTRDYKFFEAAKVAAGSSTFKVHVGAVAVYRGRVIASAASSNKTHPMQCKYNRFRPIDNIDLYLPKVHAEIGLLTKLQKMDVQMCDVKVYIYRKCKSREFGMARPCEACWRALLNAGIKSVYYTSDRGYVKEWIEDKGA